MKVAVGEAQATNGICDGSVLHARLVIEQEHPAMPQPDRGLSPDIRVADSVEDIARGRDAVLDRARTLAGIRPAA